MFGTSEQKPGTRKLSKSACLFESSFIMISINKFLSAEHRSIITFLGNVFASQALSNVIAKGWKWSEFPEKQTCLSQNPVTAFPSSRYQSTSLLHVETYGNVDCCVLFLATQISLAVSAENCISVWFVLIIKFDFFKTSC